MEQFKQRFTELYGEEIFEFLNSKHNEFIGSSQIGKDSFKIHGYTTQQINKASNDYFDYFGYFFIQKNINQNGRHSRIKILSYYASTNKLTYEEKRLSFFKRFCANFEFGEYSVQRHNGKILLSDLRHQYDYWFKYRKISKVYGYSFEELIKLIKSDLAARNIVCEIIGNKLYWRY